MLYKILKTRIKQLGGFRLVIEYARMGVLWSMVKTVLRNPFSRQSYKRAYAVALAVVEPMLKERYREVMLRASQCHESIDSGIPHEHPKVIWFCWMQGMHSAPDIVKACYSSLTGLEGYTLRVIDDKNWREYVTLPDFIVRMWEKGQIPPAHFSDLLRLELLIRYGGTWMDATILYTGKFSDSLEFLEADLFMFQYRRPGSAEWGGIGNWFISACQNNRVLIVLQEMLYAYWRDYDCVLDYYIFHLFFSMLREIFPEDIDAMPYRYARQSLILVHHWEECFDKAKWDNLVNHVCFHKLAYMVPSGVVKDKKNFYNYVLNLAQCSLT